MRATRPAIAGMHCGIPYVQVGDLLEAVVIVSGGQAFVRRHSAERMLREARRIAMLLPAGTSFVLIGYDPEPSPDLSIAQIVEDLAAVIESLFPRPVALLGLSYGGIVACWLAALHPQRVSRLMLLASGHRFSADGECRVQRQIVLAEKGDCPAFLYEFAGLFRRRWLNALLWIRVRLSRARLIRDMSEPATITRYLRAMLDAGPAPAHRIAAPVFSVGGSKDQFFGEAVMEELATLIPTARVALLREETHMAPVECRHAVSAAIGRFIDA